MALCVRLFGVFLVLVLCFAATSAEEPITITLNITSYGGLTLDEILKILSGEFTGENGTFVVSDADECSEPSLNDCHENAQCINTNGSYRCSCNPDYTGDGRNCTPLFTESTTEEASADSETTSAIVTTSTEETHTIVTEVFTSSLAADISSVAAETSPEVLEESTSYSAEDLDVATRVHGTDEAASSTLLVEASTESDISTSTAFQISETDSGDFLQTGTSTSETAEVTTPPVADQSSIDSTSTVEISAASQDDHSAANPVTFAIDEPAFATLEAATSDSNFNNESSGTEPFSVAPLDEEITSMGDTYAVSFGDALTSKQAFALDVATEEGAGYMTSTYISDSSVADVETEATYVATGAGYSEEATDDSILTTFLASTGESLSTPAESPVSDMAGTETLVGSTATSEAFGETQEPTVSDDVATSGSTDSVAKFIVGTPSFSSDVSVPEEDTNNTTTMVLIEDLSTGSTDTLSVSETAENAATLPNGETVSDVVSTVGETSTAETAPTEYVSVSTGTGVVSDEASSNALGSEPASVDTKQTITAGSVPDNATSTAVPLALGVTPPGTLELESMPMAETVSEKYETEPTVSATTVAAVTDSEELTTSVDLAAASDTDVARVTVSNSASPISLKSTVATVEEPKNSTASVSENGYTELNTEETAPSASTVILDHSVAETVATGDNATRLDSSAADLDTAETVLQTGEITEITAFSTLSPSDLLVKASTDAEPEGESTSLGESTSADMVFGATTIAPTGDGDTSSSSHMEASAGSKLAESQPTGEMVTDAAASELITASSIVEDASTGHSSLQSTVAVYAVDATQGANATGSPVETSALTNTDTQSPSVVSSTNGVDVFDADIVTKDTVIDGSLGPSAGSSVPAITVHTDEEVASVKSVDSTMSAGVISASGANNDAVTSAFASEANSLGATEGLVTNIESSADKTTTPASLLTSTSAYSASDAWAASEFSTASEDAPRSLATVSNDSYGTDGAPTHTYAAADFGLEHSTNAEFVDVSDAADASAPPPASESSFKVQNATSASSGAGTVSNGATDLTTQILKTDATDFASSSISFTAVESGVSAESKATATLSVKESFTEIGASTASPEEPAITDKAPSAFDGTVSDTALEGLSTQAHIMTPNVREADDTNTTDVDTTYLNATHPSETAGFTSNETAPGSAKPGDTTTKSATSTAQTTLVDGQSTSPPITDTSRPSTLLTSIMTFSKSALAPSSASTLSAGSAATFNHTTTPSNGTTATGGQPGATDASSLHPGYIVTIVLAIVIAGMLGVMLYRHYMYRRGVRSGVYNVNPPVNVFDPAAADPGNRFLR